MRHESLALAPLMLCLLGCGDAELTLTTDDQVRLVPAGSFGLDNAALAATASGDDGLGLVWVRPATSIGSRSAHRRGRTAASTPAGMARPGFAQEVVGQIFDASLSPSGEEAVLSGTETVAAGAPALCGRNGTLAAAWVSGIPVVDLPSGVTLDRLNVFGVLHWDAGGPVSTPTRLHPNTIGDQSFVSLACLDEFARVAAWTNDCVAVERFGQSGSLHFRPEECDAEPADGSYLAGIDGDETGDPTLVTDRVDSPLAMEAVTPREHAADGGSEILLLALSTIQKRSSDGTLLDEAPLDGPGWSRAELGCGKDQCAVVRESMDLEARLYDIDSLEPRATVTLHEGIETSGTDTTRAVDPHLACDPDGTCLVTWLLQREVIDQDAILLESLGIHGRAIHLPSGRTGPEKLLYPDEDSTESCMVEATGNGSFVLIRVVGDQIELRRVRV